MKMLSRFLVGAIAVMFVSSAHADLIITFGGQADLLSPPAATAPLGTGIDDADVPTLVTAGQTGVLIPVLAYFDDSVERDLDGFTIPVDFGFMGANSNSTAPFTNITTANPLAGFNPVFNGGVNAGFPYDGSFAATGPSTTISADIANPTKLFDIQFNVDAGAAAGTFDIDYSDALIS